MGKYTEILTLADRLTLGDIFRGEQLTQIKLACVCFPDMLRALKMARKYIVKGIVEGAYKGCSISGDYVLECVDHALQMAGEK